MRERDRLALKEWRESEERRSRAEIEQHTGKLRATHARLLEMNRKAFLQMKDPELYVSPYLENARWTLEQAIAFNKQQAVEFVAETPEYFACMENFEVLSEYFARNLTEIVDKEMWHAAYEKAKALDLLKLGPDPQPEPIQQQEQESEPERLPQSFRQPTAYRRETQETYRGIDPNTGQERDYTQVEVDLMSADLFKKVFSVPTPALTRVNFGQR
jgi:hypothetical protein